MKDQPQCLCYECQNAYLELVKFRNEEQKRKYNEQSESHRRMAAAQNIVFGSLAQLMNQPWSDLAKDIKAMDSDPSKAPPAPSYVPIPIVHLPPSKRYIGAAFALGWVVGIICVLGTLVVTA